MKKTVLAVLLVAQAIGLPHASAADTEGGFGPYENADWQTKFVVCEKAIYERDWYVYDRDLLVKGGLTTEQAEAAYEAMKESSMRMIFFNALARSTDNDVYYGKQKQVEDAMFAMYEESKDAAVSAALVSASFRTRTRLRGALLRRNS
ncbi:hypothetical protein GO998_07665 [Ralstonia syzygii]|uniref:Uncharacterized protein n=1 Tax=Ralstonia syzygii TaxID=28097 RepID=A0ABX7ZFC1_9RALS|nr:hypothetical protein [Ralstonia syzygii]QUP53643.1 hypothetical protein GO998_07665 [Ralstonia syzygii]